MMAATHGWARVAGEIRPNTVQLNQPRSDTKGTNENLRVLFVSLRGYVFSKMNGIKIRPS